MKIQWKEDCIIEIAESEDNVVSEMRKKGDIDDIDIIGYGTTYNCPDDHRFPQLQFGDGSVTLAVCADWFDVVT